MTVLRSFFNFLMISITIVSLIAAIFGMTAAYVNPNDCWLSAFAGLFLPIILSVNFFLFLFWLIQKKKWTLLPVLAILINFNFIWNIFQFSHQNLPQEDRERTKLKIATYNVRNFNGDNSNLTVRDIAHSLQTENVDFICFQEYRENPQTNEDTLKKVFHTFPYHAVSYDNQTHYSRYGLAIFSKYPIIAFQKIDFRSSTNSALWADIKIGQDTIRIINNHLQTTSLSVNRKKINQLSQENLKGKKEALTILYKQLRSNFEIRANQADLIRQITDTTTYPLIICGDFNDTPGSYTYYTIKNNLKDGFRECGKGFGYTFQGIKKLLRIDYIFYSPTFQGLNYSSPFFEWSDHNPVIMELYL